MFLLLHPVSISSSRRYPQRVQKAKVSPDLLGIGNEQEPRRNEGDQTLIPSSPGEPNSFIPSPSPAPVAPSVEEEEAAMPTPPPAPPGKDTRLEELRQTSSPLPAHAALQPPPPEEVRVHGAKRQTAKPCTASVMASDCYSFQCCGIVAVDPDPDTQFRRFTTALVVIPTVSLQVVFCYLFFFSLSLTRRAQMSRRYRSTSQRTSRATRPL